MQHGHGRRRRAPWYLGNLMLRRLHGVYLRFHHLDHALLRSRGVPVRKRTEEKRFDH